MEELEKEQEKQYIDYMFETYGEGKEMNSFYNEIQNYLEHAKISPLMNKNSAMKELLFVQNKNNREYRGYIKLSYLNCSRFNNLDKCLYITHVAITPRGGKFLSSELKRILNDNDKLDSIYIESIQSDKVLDYYKNDGWSPVNIYSNSVFIKKNKGGMKKKRKTRRYKKNKKCNTRRRR
jgi:hypothetical protein